MTIGMNTERHVSPFIPITRRIFSAYGDSQ
jgi:hypothetical protein